MVVRHLKKRRRGERSYHGRHGYPRGGGSRGGRGKSGKFDHKLMHYLKYESENIGKKGFNPPLKRTVRIINLMALSNLIDRLIIEKKVDEGNIEIDLNKLGYDKLLSKGEINKKVTIRVKAATKRAIEKIEKTGGRVILCQ